MATEVAIERTPKNTIEFSAKRKLLKKISDLSGEKINACMHCGICSGTCPMSTEMDITPARIMLMVKEGQEDVLNSKAIWICSSCHSCTVRCPRGLDLAKIAEALRQTKLRLAVDHIDIRDFSEEEIMELPQIAFVGCFRKMTG